MTFLLRILSLFSLQIVAFSAVAHASPAVSFTELSGQGQSRSITLDTLKGQPALLLFWRSDCAPCLQELSILPEIASAHPELPIALISLEDKALVRAHLPALPSNVRVLVANGDGRDALAAFGGEGLPFAVALHIDGSVCAKRYGILGSDIVNQWEKLC